jgi:cytolysin-activating lysine-acyltransferase
MMKVDARLQAMSGVTDAIAGGSQALRLILAAFRPANAARSGRLDAAFARMIVNILPPLQGRESLVVDRGPDRAPLLHFCCSADPLALLMAAGDVAWALRLAFGRRVALRGATEGRLRLTAGRVLMDHVTAVSPEEGRAMLAAFSVLQARYAAIGADTGTVAKRIGPDALWPFITDEILWAEDAIDARILTVRGNAIAPGVPDGADLVPALRQAGLAILQKPGLADLRCSRTHGPDGQRPPQDLALILGAVADLLAGSAYHRQFDPVSYIADEVLPPLMRGQAILALSGNGHPVALVTWARISAETEMMLHRTGRALLPAEWDAGPRLFFNDWITPGLPVWLLVHWLRDKFPDQSASSLRRRPDRSIRRINAWRRDTPASAIPEMAGRSGGKTA